MTREPVGVVGLITPWNFPLAIPAWKIAPALAYGNCVVFKPAELVPACAWALADIISRAGLPPGVLNLVMGPGSRGRATPSPSRRRCTASASPARCPSAPSVRRRGRWSAARACSSRWAARTRWSCSTTPISRRAVGTAVNGAFFQTGQRCTASSRLIVTAGHPRPVRRRDDRAHEDARGRRRAQARHRDRPGGRASRQLEQNLSYIEIGRDEGATLALGGERLNRADPGLLHGAGALHRHDATRCASTARRSSGRSPRSCR